MNFFCHIYIIVIVVTGVAFPGMVCVLEKGE